MKKNIGGNNGIILDINLSNGIIKKEQITYKDQAQFLGGRGLGMKLLWDRVNTPGIDPLGPENPLMFMPGSMCSLPLPGAARCTVVTKSAHSSHVSSKYPMASTVTYSNIGGFLGPEIKFAGYDGIVITGKAASPVIIVIDDDHVSATSCRQRVFLHSQVVLDSCLSLGRVCSSRFTRRWPLSPHLRRESQSARAGRCVGTRRLRCHRTHVRSVPRSDVSRSLCAAVPGPVVRASPSIERACRRCPRTTSVLRGRLASTTLRI